MQLKRGVRILALNGSRFDKKGGKELVIGIVGRNGLIEGSLSFYVSVDGNDSTENLIRALEESKFGEQVRVIVINGITLAGLNILDFEEVSKRAKAGMIAITRKKPRKSLLIASLHKDGERKFKEAVIRNTYKKVKISRIDGFYFQLLGIDENYARSKAKELLSLLRIAHIISSGIALGESRGRI